MTFSKSAECNSILVYTPLNPVPSYPSTFERGCRKKKHVPGKVFNQIKIIPHESNLTAFTQSLEMNIANVRKRSCSIGNTILHLPTYTYINTNRIGVRNGFSTHNTALSPYVNDPNTTITELDFLKIFG